jgi:hypothetical protein
MSDIPPDDYAKLHYCYHEDPDLAIIAHTLDEEHGMGWLVWLYWPRMIAKAKQSKALGWFRTTPRELAASVHDPIASGGLWAARARMWELLAEYDLIRVHQGAVEHPSARIDVLLVEYERWQSLSNKEKQRLKRERAKFRAGEPVDWTVRHWSEFAFTPVVCDTEIPAGDTERAALDTVSVVRDTEIGVSDTTLDKTRQDKTKEGARGRALPPSVLETIDLVRDIPGLSRWQIESHVRKAMAQYPSLPDASICEAITAFETRIPEGKTVNSAKAWQTIRNCFDVARRRLDEGAATASTPTGSAPVALLEEFRALRSVEAPA